MYISTKYHFFQNTKHSHGSLKSDMKIIFCCLFLKVCILFLGTLNAASAVVPETTDTLNTSTSSQNTTECIVCYEKAVDCVIYTCGHMCLCYECGLQQWRGRGAGICPMCRMPIRDIIRTYRN